MVCPKLAKGVSTRAGQAPLSGSLIFSQRRHYKNGARSGMTLIEVLVAAVIMVAAMVGVLSSFIRCLELSALGQDVTIASQGLQAKLEQIKTTAVSSISSTYNNTTFTISGLNGIGVVYVDSSISDLLTIKLAFSWRTSYGRVIGGDKNLNGTWQTGETRDANGRLESYVQIITKIGD